MQITPFLAALPFALLGLHLARIARRSGATPDRLLTAYFLLLAAGIPPRMLGANQALAAGAANAGSYAFDMTANALIGCAMTCLAAFTWKVFRPDDAWARRLVVGFGCVLVAGFAVAATSVEASSGAGLPMVVFNALNFSANLWAFVECLRYYRMMRLRGALGLADPVIANRFLLWSVWTGALALLTAAILFVRVGMWSSGAGDLMAAGADASHAWLGVIQGVRVLLAVVAPTVVIAVWLSFSPPAAYRRWVASLAS